MIMAGQTNRRRGKPHSDSDNMVCSSWKSFVLWRQYWRKMSLTRLKWIVKKSSMKMGKIGSRNDSLGMISNFFLLKKSISHFRIFLKSLFLDSMSGILLWASMGYMTKM